MTYVSRACIIACRLALALALAAGASCRQVVDFEKPNQALREPNHDAGTDAKPFLSDPECTRCIEENCPKESAACAADEFCSRWLEDVRALVGPAIAAPDVYHELTDALWAADHGETSVLGAFGDFYYACLVDRCTTACELGRDFSCVGKFAWPESHPRRTEMLIKVFDGVSPASSFDGWRVQACARQSVCQRPMGEATTQDGGFATLAVDFSLAPPGAVLPEFNGFLLIDSGPDYMPTQLDLSVPIYDRDSVPIYVWKWDLVVGAAEARGLPVDSSRALLEIWASSDCSYFFPATRVTVEVWNYEESGFRLCTDCRIAYPDDNGFPDPTLTDFSPRSIASIAPASATSAPGDIMVVMRDTMTRRPLSVLRPITVRAGYAHSIMMSPASAAQLDDLPEEAR